MLGDDDECPMAEAPLAEADFPVELAAEAVTLLLLAQRGNGLWKDKSRTGRIRCTGGGVFCRRTGVRRCGRGVQVDETNGFVSFSYGKHCLLRRRTL